jgi:hypothetical protein
MKKLALTSLLIGALSSVNALEFQPVGFESISMGGAGVASAKGSNAGYYNPALLAKSKLDVEVAVGVGLGIRENNLADNLDTLSNTDLTNTIDTIANNALTPANNTQATRDNLKLAQDTLKAIGTSNGLALMPTGFLGIQVKNFGLGIYGLADMTARLNVDSSKTDLILEFGGNYYSYNPTTNSYALSTQAQYQTSSLDYALDNKDTYLQLSGIALTEVPLSYAHKFDTSFGDLSIGASLKFMSGTTYNQKIEVDTASDDVEDLFDSSEKKSSNIGFDLGVLYNPSALDKLAIGFVAKNVNTPKFETITSAEYEVEPMLRAGIAYDFDLFDVALDFDLSKNKTFIDDYESQYVGGGINFNPLSWFSVRVGAMQNLADDVEGTILTAGLGFGLKWIQIDVSGQMSSESGSFDGEEIPKYSKVNLAFVSKW